MKVVLASASERRHELLKRLVEEFDIIVSNFDEDSVIFNGNPEDYVIELSKGKALDVGGKLTGDYLIIGCDTIVSLGHRVLGKPQNREDAKKMLQSLGGNTHQVYSGITLLSTASGRILTDYVKTDVKFSALNDRDIDRYIETGEPMDKAGAYGIQGHGGVFVEEIHGCYYNVVGLPLSRLKALLKEMGVNL